MEYKIGDEVLVKARIVGSRNGVSRLLVQSQQDKFFVENNNVIPAPDMTAEEAWKLAKMICLDRTETGFKETELAEIFGDNLTYHIMYENSPQQAKAKIEAWKAKKEIKVGDEVVVCGDKGIVTSFGTDGDALHVLYFDGIVNSYRRDKDVKKTGRHIDIDGVLKQIGGDE